MTALDRITNRIFRRNGHATPSFSQSSPIAMPEKQRPATPTTEYFVSARPITANPGVGLAIGKEHAEIGNEMMLGGPLGLVNDMPVLSSLGLHIVDSMMTDSAVGTYIELKKIAALSTPWSWEAAGDEPDQKEHAAYLTEVFDQLDSGEQDNDGSNVGVKNKLRDMLSAIEYGFSITNVVLSILESGEFKGKLGIADLKTKPPHNFSFDCDPFLNIRPNGILYTGSFGHIPERLPSDAFIVYSYRAQFGNPYGYSDCIRAYDRWNSKRWVQKLWDIYLERHGCGTWVALEDKDDPASASERAAVDSFLVGAQARSALRVSSRFTIEPHEPAAGSSDNWNMAIDARNMEIARTIFQPDKVGFSAPSASGGAYAMSQTHFDVWMMILSSLQADISAKMKQQGRKLVKASFGVQDKYPNFVFAPMSNEQKAWWLTSVISALEKGALVPDQAVMKKVREVLELPEQENPEELPVLPGQIDPNDPNPDPDPSGDPPQPPMPEDMAALVDSIKDHGRVIVVGGPRTGKTLFSVAAAYKHGRAHRHTDSLMGALGWSDSSAKVAEWFGAPGNYVIEGVATVRALRKWLLANPDTALPATIVKFDVPRVKLTARQEGMRKGTETIWSEIEPELVRRGATIIRAR